MREAYAAKMFPSRRIIISLKHENTQWNVFTLARLFNTQLTAKKNQNRKNKKNRLCLFRKRSRHASLPNYGGGETRFGWVATVC